MQLHIDIETIPNLDDAAIAEIRDSITAPGNYKKPESIAEWMAENRERLVDEKVYAAGLDGTTGKIICIAWAWENMPVTVTKEDNEAALLCELFNDIHGKNLHASATTIGHNVSWDLRYIWQRAVVNGIRPPVWVKWQGKPWDHLDTMLMWNPDNQRRISLDRLCKVLGVPTSKGELDGAKIWQAYRDGRMAEIRDYCIADVEAMRACYRKLTFA